MLYSIADKDFIVFLDDEQSFEDFHEPKYTTQEEKTGESESGESEKNAS